ncbi:NAD(P)H-binding protein [Tardiphaga robiniae]|uniref:Epimerase n=1 Tax=Tardiphaga robiniae TaxID=943830 RepID=A0A161SRU7_9BRAD|nr:NAD(P)H-binding protein [Tardiphaga robiniae]KZD23962.1 epimerase [Tardiphaga robiniae]
MDGKSALVLGATGGVGGAIASALVEHGWSVCGLARDVPAAKRGWPNDRVAIVWVAGDAMNGADVIHAAAGTSVIVHAVNPPGYRHWDRLVLPMIDNSIAAARAAGGARIVLPGTVYNFNPATTPVVGEDSEQMPQSRKGRVRVEMEARLDAAARSGVPSLIVRAGDFFGADARSSWFTQVMAPPGKQLRRIVNPVTAPGVGHSWAYLPDLAEAIARLIGMKEKLRPFERLQFEGVWDADGTALPAAIRRITQRPDIPVTRFSWRAMRLLAPFGGLPREIAEIAPYWRYPMRFDNRRLVALLGEEPHTPIDDALKATFRIGTP